ncbi:MAG TPA: PD-(D/E)XK nuclease family protein [Bryobacteraceae bacterium]|nr:PD-(D/E)XK nuclease family protein [Bryobacteraceae bacterium]
MRPNLFEFATKELSQDAFFCWVLAWADKENAAEDKALNELGLSVVNSLLGMWDVPQQQATVVKIHRQFMRADIVAEVGDGLVILIEDKVHAGVHGDQLERYLENMQRSFPGKRILPVLLKTGDQSSYRDVEKAGYRLLLRDRILALLRPWKQRISDRIFLDFLADLESREAQVESYATKPVSLWTGEWEPWIGFYRRLQQELSSDPIEWDYVANASGGFLGAWWHFRGWDDQTVYLQIEQGPLCFKIQIQQVEGIAAFRERWRESLATAARDMGTDVPRPTRMGSGTCMTVGRIQLKEWMAQRQDGLLDLDHTLETLRRAGDLLDRAVKSSSRHLAL